ncbi:MAG: ATP-binding protein [Frankiaceae bacterium]
MTRKRDEPPPTGAKTPTAGFEALGGARVATAILADSCDAVVVCDLSARVVAWNRAAESALGWTAEEALGRAASHFLEPSQPPARQPPGHLPSGAAGDLPDGQRGTVFLRHRDGTAFPAQLTRSGVFAPSGEPAGVLTVVRSLSVERADSAGPPNQRSRVTRRLAEAYHDMRQPLTTIEYLLQDALNYEDDAASRGTLLSISQQVKYVTDLAAHVLGEYRAVREPVDLGALLRAAAATVRGESAKDSVPVEVAAPAGLIVLADEVELHRAVINLVENAIRAAGAAGRVRVSAVPRAGMVALLVEDSGPGYAGREGYAGEGDSRGEADSGRSLGLLITDRVARAHGGRLEWGVSRRLGGAAFWLLLPDAHS